jgi:type II secretory pathway pseudopilin PulG
VKTKRSTSICAFTLLEVILAMSVLALLVGMLWTVVKSSVGSAYYIEQSQIEQQQYVALNSFLENLFRKIPAEAQITSRLKDQGSQGLSLLYLTNAPGAISMLNQGASLDTVILGAREQIGGYVQFSLYTSASSIDKGGNDNEFPPLDLIKDLASIQWRYFDARTQQWMLDWLDGSTKPALVELTLKPPGKSEIPKVFVYWIPPLARATPYFPQPNAGDSPQGTPPNTPEDTTNNFMPRPGFPGSPPYGPRPLPGMRPQPR